MHDQHTSSAGGDPQRDDGHARGAGERSRRGGQRHEPRRGAPATAAVFRRRRRTAALAIIGLVAVMALIGGIAVGSSHRKGSGGKLAAAPPIGFFSRIGELAGNGTGSFAARERAAENAAIDHTLAYTPFVRIAGSEKREVALTFDDGPGPYTPRILAALRRYHAPATFFEVGVMLQYFHASASAIVARGDPIGDHTELHRPMSQLSKSDQRSELLEQAEAIGRYGAPFPRLFRPPYGGYDATTLSLLHQYRMLMVMWTVDSDDYLRPGSARIVRNVLSGARPGAIILLHDAGGDRTQTIEALPKIIRRLRARGYRLVTVPRLLLDDPPPRGQTQLPPSSLAAG